MIERDMSDCPQRTAAAFRIRDALDELVDFALQDLAAYGRQGIGDDLKSRLDQGTLVIRAAFEADPVRIVVYVVNPSHSGERAFLCAIDIPENDAAGVVH